jgi:hypothetical protein
MSEKEMLLKGETAASTSLLIERIRAEYVEMPGLSLTVTQAARFWGLSTMALKDSRSSLVESGFLLCDKKGCYRRCP